MNADWDDYDDYRDAAEKDGEAVIMGRHGGCILRGDLLDRAAVKASARRFTGEAPTGFGTFADGAGNDLSAAIEQRIRRAEEEEGDES